MCGKKLKRFFVLLELSSLFFFVPSLSLCYAEVRLTEEQATQVMNEIQESKKDLIQVKNELTESKKESQELKMELQDVKEDCNEQKIYYETQLTEAKKREKNSFFLSLLSNLVSALLSVVILISFIF